MEKQIEVITQTKELLATVNEALNHVQLLLKEGKFEKTIPLFGDVVQAFSTLENTVIGLPDELLTDEAKELTVKVRNALEITVSSYETKSYGKVQEVLQFTLLPRFKKWKENLEKSFKSYLVN